MQSFESWRDGPVRRRIIDFVASVTGANGSEPVPVEERVAVFDNDGTLWCEKPMPIQADFILRRLAAMAEETPALREKQPWQAAHERTSRWFSRLMDEHYAGDDSNVRILAGGILAAYDGMSVEDFEAAADSFLRSASHPTLGIGYLETAYKPMIELLDYLSANGFANYIVSGGGRDFMRPITQDVYGIPRERVIGSTAVLAYASTSAAARSRTRPSLTTSTTARRSRSGSGAASAGGRCSPAATRTVTSRCSTTAGTEGHPVPAAARHARRRRARVRLHERRGEGARTSRRGRLDGREHQERLVDGLRDRSDAAFRYEIGEPARSRLPLGSTSASSRSPYSVSTGGCRRLPVAGSLGTPIRFHSA